jgi:sulfonate transport system permease protein
MAVWIIGSSLSVWNSYIIPSPVEVWNSAYKLAANGILFKHAAVSLYRVFAGFLAAFLLAFPLGVFLGMNSQTRDYFQTLLEFVRHVPPLAALPMLILWFGIGEWPKLLIVVLATFFPIFLNTLHGVATCDWKLIEVGRSFGFGRREIFRRIVLPAALPSVLVGMRLGLGYSWRALVGAELIAASSGIGYMILDAEQLARPDIVVLGILTIGILGSVIDGVFFRVTQMAIPWKGGDSASYDRG